MVRRGASRLHQALVMSPRPRKTLFARGPHDVLEDFDAAFAKVCAALQR
jgi:hypothetical protein